MTRYKNREISNHGIESTALSDSRYLSWKAMRSRCLSPTATGYKNYGGRGITIDPMWEHFWTFAFDMGPRPSLKHTLDRINNEGNYEPSNCRWSTYLVQWHNSRPKKPRPPYMFFTYNGETLSMKKWAQRLGRSVAGVHHYLKKYGTDKWLEILHARRTK